MQKKFKGSAQKQKEMIFSNPDNQLDIDSRETRQGVLERVNFSVFGLLFMTGWLFIAMKSGDVIQREAIPAYLIICCLLFFTAIDRKQ